MHIIQQPIPKTPRPVKAVAKSKTPIKAPQVTKDPEYKAVNTEDEYQYDVFDDEDAFDRARYALYEQIEDEDE